MPNDVIPADTEHPNVLNALTRKRAEIAGKIEQGQLEIRRLIAELDHVDATIRLFDPAIDKIGSKLAAPRHAAFKGEVTRVLQESLRTAPASLTSRDLALSLMTERTKSR